MHAEYQSLVHSICSAAHTLCNGKSAAYSLIRAGAHPAQTCLRAAQRLARLTPHAHFISGGGEGGEAALGSEDSDVVGGAFGSSLSSGGSASGAAAREKAGWQRRWTMVAMCFVAFMVRDRAGSDGASHCLA